MKKYRSENDKCYGAAGMVIGLGALNAIDALSSVTIDAEGFDCLKMSHDFLISDQLLDDPCEAWQQSVTIFDTGMALVIADRLCRKMILDRGVVDRKMRNQMLAELAKEGKSVCDLEKDEVEEVFEKYFQHMVKVFSSPVVRGVISQLVTQLQQRRQLSYAEVEELLAELQNG